MVGARGDADMGEVIGESGRYRTKNCGITDIAMEVMSFARYLAP